jgi:hypothetical protein
MFEHQKYVLLSCLFNGTEGTEIMDFIEQPATNGKTFSPGFPVRLESFTLQRECSNAEKHRSC